MKWKRRYFLSTLAVFALIFSCREPLVEEVAAEDNFKNETLKRVNALRAEGRKCGDKSHAAAPALVWNDKLEKAAKRHSKDMANNDHFDHEGTDGSDFWQRIKDADYEPTTGGENIAWGHRSAAEAIDGWSKSPGHCRNMMNANYKEIGVAEKDGYWTMVLATKSGSN